MRPLVIPLSLGLALACAADKERQTSRSPASDKTLRTYATQFTEAESPVSEGGQWLNGGTVGRDWTNVSITPGRAVGHQIAARNTDATAILSGNWRPDQATTAAVFVTGPLNEKCRSEVQLRLRSTIALHSNRGYQVAFAVSQTPNAYLRIVRWDGVLGDATTLLTKYGVQFGVKSGDVLRATIVGHRITVYKNGLELAHVSDAGIPTGSPGMGFGLENSHAGCPGTNDRYGFSQFSAAEIIEG
jgi:hypothetical protein